MNSSTNKECEDRRSFVEILWAMPEDVMIQSYITAKGSGDPQTALAILEAKALRATQDTAESNRILAVGTDQLARQTKKLANMTVMLAIATVVLAVATVLLA